MRLLLVILLSSWAPAAVASPAAKPGLPVSLTYFGEWGVYPGARVSVPYKALTHGGHALLVEPGIAVRHHPGHSTALFAEALTGYRYTLGFGGFIEFSAGAGYGRAFAAGPVYERGGDGRMQPVRDGGVPVALASVNPTIGFDAGARGALPLAVFVRPRAVWSGSGLSDLTLYPVVEAGFTWTFAR